MAWWKFVLLIYITRSSFCGRPEQFYRLVDKNLACNPATVVSSITAYSLSSCGAACKVEPSCFMFAVDNMKRTDLTYSKPKADIRMMCELCKPTNSSLMVERAGWSAYMKWMKEIKFNILETDNQASLPNLKPDDLWSVDCNSRQITKHNNGVIIAIWDDKDDFDDLDKVKCFNWGDKDIFDDKPSRLLHINLEDYRQCPKDYVLTAIAASNEEFKNVDKGKCSPLAPEYQVDYDRCVTMSSENKVGGTINEWRPWKVQCPNLGPHVAVSLHKRRKIHTGLKCCVVKGIIPEGQGSI